MEFIVALIGAYVALEIYHIGRQIGHLEAPILVVRESLEDHEHEDHPLSAPTSPEDPLDLVSVSAPASDEE